VRDYIQQGLDRDTALRIAGVSRHQYYHTPKSEKRGRKPTYTTERQHHWEPVVSVEEPEVADEIRKIKSRPEGEDYGYRKVCVALMLMGYRINHKKVYRIMSAFQLLNDRHKRPQRTYVRYRKVTPTQPLEVIEMDIKYQWVERERRNAYILTILDTFTRTVLYWGAGYQMKQEQIRQAWDQVIINYLQPANLLSRKVHLEIRNDNGSQFAAQAVQTYFRDNHLRQVFTHPYTPQENGHIESFHAILSRGLDKQRFFSLRDLEPWLNRFYKRYNQERLHSSIANLPPMLFWQLWDQGLIERREMAKGKVSFKLTVPYQQLSGKGSPRLASCKWRVALNGQSAIKMIRPESFQPSV